MIPYELVTIVIFVALIIIHHLHKTKVNAVAKQKELENINVLLREDNFNHQTTVNKEVGFRREAERVLKLARLSEAQSSLRVKTLMIENGKLCKMKTIILSLN